MIKNKQIEADNRIAETKVEIAKVQEDTNTINEKTTQYETFIKNLEEINNKISTQNSLKNIIPNLLNAIMYRIPAGVQVTSIENTNSRHIKIGTQSLDYDQLGFFLARIREQGILLKVQSNTGVMQNGLIKMTIEGEMP